MQPRAKSFVLFLIYVVAANVLSGAIGLLFVALRLVDIHDRSWRPSLFVAAEMVGVLGAFFATWVVVAAGPRSPSQLGYARKGAPAQLLVGSLFGLGAVVVLVAGIAALSGFTLGSLAMKGDMLAKYTAAWLCAFLLVGVAEEMDYRAAGLFTLAEAIGFWPAATALSLIFAAAHYFMKPMENIADAMSVGLLGLFMSFTVLRTGAIWFAVGFHALFDYAAIYIFGAPNSGNGGHPIATRMFSCSYQGPAWLTGGPLGVEASWLVFPVIALLFAAFSLACKPLGYNPPQSVQKHSGGTA